MPIGVKESTSGKKTPYTVHWEVTWFVNQVNLHVKTAGKSVLWKWSRKTCPEVTLKVSGKLKWVVLSVSALQKLLPVHSGEGAIGQCW